jgi:hypothetical protein
MMGDSSMERILVTVDDQHLGAIESVVTALRAAGMSISNVMPTTGVIVGAVAPDNKSTLAGLQGVEAIEPDDEMRAI